MALDDHLTAQKNGVVAINNLSGTTTAAIEAASTATAGGLTSIGADIQANTTAVGTVATATNAVKTSVDAVKTAVDGVTAEIGTVSAATDAILSNILTAVQALSTVYKYFHGNSTSGALTAQTLISAGSGYLTGVCVVVAGSAAGTINNAATTGAAAAGNVLFATPNTAGFYPLGVRFTAGLVVSPGTGQTISVTYSLD